MSAWSPLPVVVLSVEPIHVAAPAVEQAAASGASTGFPWMLAITIVVGIATLVALGVVAIGAAAAFRRIRALHPEEQAFRALCKAMRIPPAVWPELRALAKRIDAEPVALLVSRTAFDRATGPRPSDLAPTLIPVRSRLFGDDHAP